MKGNAGGSEAQGPALPAISTKQSGFVPMPQLKPDWLLQGPDSYDPLDITVGPTKETRIDYSPLVIWGISVLNNAPTGGDRVLVRFTDGKGKTKQIPINPQSSSDLDLKGLSSVVRFISQTTSVEVTGIVLLKQPR